MRISNSELQTFKRCRRKWWLAYERGLTKRRQPLTGAAQLGTRVHEALAAYYSPDIGADPVKYLDEIYVWLMSGELDEVESADVQKEWDLAHLMVEGYMEWLQETGADEELEVVASEREFSTQLVDIDREPVTIQGKLDVVVRRRVDDAHMLIDHKTAGDLAGKGLQQSEQRLMYQMLQRLTRQDEAPVRGTVYNLLRKVKRTPAAKPPFYGRLWFVSNTDELNSYWYRLVGMITDIIRTRHALSSGAPHQVAAYPTPTANCSWDCEFQQVCPLFDDGSRAEDALAELYITHDPYDRYTTKGDTE